EQVLLWNPDVIITIDQDFAANVSSDPAWAPVAAVRAHRVHLSPKLPFGWVDFPPDGEPVDRPVVACENPVPGFIPRGFARAPGSFRRAFTTSRRARRKSTGCWRAGIEAVLLPPSSSKT